MTTGDAGITPAVAADPAPRGYDTVGFLAG